MRSFPIASLTRSRSRRGTSFAVLSQRDLADIGIPTRPAPRQPLTKRCYVSDFVAVRSDESLGIPDVGASEPVNECTDPRGRLSIVINHASCLRCPELVWRIRSVDSARVEIIERDELSFTKWTPVGREELDYAGADVADRGGGAGAFARPRDGDVFAVTVGV